MKIFFKIGFILLIGGIFLVGYKAQANEQQHCNEFNEQSEYVYKLVSGTVIKAGIVPPRPVECDPSQGDCSWVSKTWFFAVLRPIGVADSNDENKFTIYTKKEEREDLIQKKPYMEPGKSYAFCARGPEEGSKYTKKIVYRVDHVETINELK